MKIGFCMLSWAEPATRDGDRLIAEAAATGYDGVEIPVVHGTVEDHAALGRRLDEFGLDRTALTVMPKGANPASANAGERQTARDRIAWCLDSVAALGATLLVGPVHHTVGEFTGLPPTDVEYARLTEFHRYAGDLAAAHGIRIAIEPMSRFESHLFNTMEGLAKYLGMVDHPAISGMFDTFHANIEESDPIGAIAAYIDRIAHFHVSESTRGVPGEGHVPWPRVYGALKAAGYDGWLTVESFGRANPDLAAATRVWRDFARSPEEVCRRAYLHIREGWDRAGR